MWLTVILIFAVALGVLIFVTAKTRRVNTVRRCIDYAVRHVGTEKIYPRFYYDAVLLFMQEQFPQYHKTEDDETVGVMTCTVKDVNYTVIFKKTEKKELSVVANVTEDQNTKTQHSPEAFNNQKILDNTEK